MSDLFSSVKSSAFVKNIATAGLTDLETAVIKATYDDDDPPKEKHVARLVSASMNDRDFSFYQLIEKRLDESSWRIVLKALILLHRIFRDGDVAALRRVARDKRHISRLTTFSDPDALTSSTFTQKYCKFLLSKLDVYAYCKYSGERVPPSESRSWSLGLNLRQVIESLPRIQRQFDTLLEVEPEVRKDEDHPIIRSAMAMLLRDALRIYGLATVQLSVAMDKYKEMNMEQLNTLIKCSDASKTLNQTFRRWLRVVQDMGLSKDTVPQFVDFSDKSVRLLHEQMARLHSEQTTTPPGGMPVAVEGKETSAFADTTTSFGGGRGRSQAVADEDEVVDHLDSFAGVSSKPTTTSTTLPTTSTSTSSKQVSTATSAHATSAATLAAYTAAAAAAGGVIPTHSASTQSRPARPAPAPVSIPSSSASASSTFFSSSGIPAPTSTSGSSRAVAPGRRGSSTPASVLIPTPSPTSAASVTSPKPKKDDFDFGDDDPWADVSSSSSSASASSSNFDPFGPAPAPAVKKAPAPTSSSSNGSSSLDFLSSLNLGSTVPSTSPTPTSTTGFDPLAGAFGALNFSSPPSSASTASRVGTTAGTASAGNTASAKPAKPAPTASASAVDPFASLFDSAPSGPAVPSSTFSAPLASVPLSPASNTFGGMNGGMGMGMGMGMGAGNGGMGLGMGGMNNMNRGMGMGMGMGMAHTGMQMNPQQMMYLQQQQQQQQAGFGSPMSMGGMGAGHQPSFNFGMNANPGMMNMSSMNMGGIGMNMGGMGGMGMNTAQAPSSVAFAPSVASKPVATASDKASDPFAFLDD